MLHLSMPSNQQRGQIFWTWNNHRTDLDILFKIMFHDIFLKFRQQKCCFELSPFGGGDEGTLQCNGPQYIIV